MRDLNPRPPPLIQRVSVPNFARRLRPLGQLAAMQSYAVVDILKETYLFTSLELKIINDILMK